MSEKQAGGEGATELAKTLYGAAYPGSLNAWDDLVSHPLAYDHPTIDRFMRIAVAAIQALRPTSPAAPLEEEVIRRGQECAVWLTGDPEDAADITSVDVALKAIDEALKIGIERNDELKRLQPPAAPASPQDALGGTEPPKCNEAFPDRPEYLCYLPLGHSGQHEAECSNPQFHQRWPWPAPPSPGVGPTKLPESPDAASGVQVSDKACAGGQQQTVNSAPSPGVGEVASCQSVMLGIKCDGHIGHGHKHFNRIGSDILLWFDESHLPEFSAAPSPATGAAEQLKPAIEWLPEHYKPARIWAIGGFKLIAEICEAYHAYAARLSRSSGEPTFVDDLSRCAVCGWPLAACREDGCIRGDCSLRPGPEHLYSAERAATERDELLESYLKATLPSDSGRKE